jgi:hypothetical protein
MVWVAALVAAAVCGCGGGDEARTDAAEAGRVVQGETETGMKLKVESFIRPADDRLLQRVDAYRAAAGYPAVDYHRVTADAGAIADRPRRVRFAANAGDLSAGKGVDGRFGCDVLNLEWLPARKASQATFDALRRSLCEPSPAEAEAIAPGAHVVYYLVTDRGFAERGLRSKRIFGPRDAELL